MPVDIIRVRQIDVSNCSEEVAEKANSIYERFAILIILIGRARIDRQLIVERQNELDVMQANIQRKIDSSAEPYPEELKKEMSKFSNDCDDFNHEKLLNVATLIGLERMHNQAIEELEALGVLKD